MTKHTLIIFTFILQAFCLHAGSFKHLSVTEGLSSRQVFQINKDSTGFIWIFTHLGVDRYDGNEIRHYKLDETLEAKDHILSSTVMTCDKDGKLWISLKNGKIYAYNKQTDSFMLMVDLAKLLPSPIILNDILFDNSNQLYLCLSTGIYFDTNKMNNIMDNLLSNAIKYTQEGSITITASYTKSKWMVQIEDTGIGIPEKEQRNLFHQFYRAGNAINSDESGSGIGLFLIRKMIHLHHGKISFTSIENQGTTFTVTFPRKIRSAKIIQPNTDKEESIPVIELPQTAKGTLTSTHKNILLLAEDNDDMREYLTDRLSEEYEVISVTDGGKALETARELNPDIIISDIIMPVLQGDELCRILKSSVETSHIPVILLTALNERENVILGLEAGANDYIIKPFDFSMLKLRIRNILQSRQHLRETVLSSDINLNEIDYSSQLDKEFLDKAIDIINTELSNPEFAINDFCNMLCMGRTSVYNKIKTLTGQSPNDFIRIIRMNRSKELILSRKHTIGEVSSMVGFSDPKYFSTCFKKQFGISPSKI